VGADFDVVIIGAGAAGIAAARRLAATRLSFLLVEASARVGGRAWTHELAGLRLDFGCEWLHSADRNPWTGIAENLGVAIERLPAAWGVQYRNLGFSQAEQAEARQAYAAWSERLAKAPPSGDRASDALEPGGKWNAYITALCGYISGGAPDHMSAGDYVAYDEASTENNWRAPGGYGALIAASLPRPINLRLSTSVDSMEGDREGVLLRTSAGTIRARTAILTVSTAVLASGAIRLPRDMAPWIEAASRLPLGRNEKIFFEILDDGPFEPETHLLGDPRDARTASYYIRPLGAPVIECFFGGEGARAIEEAGVVAGYDYARDRLVSLFGSSIKLRPLASTSWTRETYIGGAYSYALPGQSDARKVLARPFEQRIFLAGEATHVYDFSTAHGAHDSGVRAAGEAIAALASSAG
jgi:monoamine oxidase